MGNYRWVPASSSNCDLPGALLAGHDQDGTAIYAGRAYHDGNLLPAKVIPAKSVAYVAFAGQEIVKDQFEVLTLLTQNALTWVWGHGSQVPDGAIQVGQTSDGEPLYFGRVNRDGALTVGKIHPSHNCCYFPFAGAEHSSSDYEALVQQ